MEPSMEPASSEVSQRLNRPSQITSLDGLAVSIVVAATGWFYDDQSRKGCFNVAMEFAKELTSQVSSLVSDDSSPQNNQVDSGGKF